MSEPATRRSALLIAWALPVGTAAALNAPGPLWFLLPASALLLRLFRLAADGESPDRAGRTARASRMLVVLLPVLGLLVLARIVIVPYSLYETWFRLIELGRSGGTVSHVFIWAAAYLGVLAGGSVYHFGLRGACSALVLAALLLAGIATGSPAVFAAAAAAGALTVSQYAGGVSEAEPGGGSAVHGRRDMRLRIAAGLIAIASIAATPALMIDGGTGNVLIDRVISPGLRQAIIRLFPHFPLHYGTGMHGYTLNSANLTGRPSLSQSAVFEVTAPPGEVLYLRNETFDTYSWRSWQRSPRLEESKERSDRGILADDPPDGNGITVRFLGDMYERVPHTLSTVHVDLPPRSADAGITGDIDSGFTFHAPPARGRQITLYEGEFERSALERLGSRRRTGVYLQLPPDLPRSVSALGHRLRAEGGDTRETLERIAAHLADGFQYTLDPSIPPDDRDFVQDFLFYSRKGYCVQFATSFVILARVSGIPARYATGFLVPVPDSFEEEADASSDRADGRVTTTVTGLRAHAWPEVWIPDEGWTIWEATPPMRGEGTPASTSGDSLTQRQLEEMGRSSDAQEQMLDDIETSDDSAADPAHTGDEADRRRDAGRGGDLEPLAIVALIVVTGAVLVLPIARFRRRRLPAEPRAAYDATMARLVRHLESAGVARPARTGYRLWAANAARKQPEYSGCFRRAAETTQRMLFASYTPTDAERHMLTRLERAVRKKRLAKKR